MASNQAGAGGEVLAAQVAEERLQLLVEGAVEIRCGTGDEPNVAGGVDEDVAVRVVDVVGQGTVRQPVDRRGVVLVDLLVEEAGVVGQAGEDRRGLGHQLPGRPGELGVRGAPGGVCRARGRPELDDLHLVGAAPSSERAAWTCERFPVVIGQMSSQSVRNGTTIKVFPRKEPRDTVEPCWSVSGRLSSAGGTA